MTHKTETKEEKEIREKKEEEDKRREREKQRQEQDQRQTRDTGDMAKPGDDRTKSAQNMSREARASTTETRQMLVSLYCQGATNDAKALYAASAGATDAGWHALERMLAPVKSFILDSGMPYAYNVPSTEYAGLPVPEPEQPPENPEPPETRSRGEYSAGRQPGNLSADVENEIEDRGGKSLDANPGSRPGGGKTVEEHLDREKKAEDKSKQ